ncbi:MAG: YifB family Mg chelatase-like AAA ATPase [Eubacteriales bacterium]|nr:YifB family Mg chelatase-like AAA ATPase [Eubacteriales bacterium]
MSFSRIMSATLQGMEVIPVQVEADVSNGLPVFHMVGYLSAEVKEAGERVRTAIHNSDITIPAKRTVINLSPGNVRKRGTSYDLPIALSILMAIGELESDCLDRVMAVGELGLDGSVRGIHGILPIAAKARKEGATCLIVPAANEEEARLVEGLRVLGTDSLRRLCEILRSRQKAIGSIQEHRQDKIEKEEKKKADFADIRGQQAVKRAAEVAVAGHHNLLMIGPPGGGKSMIARRIPTILPSLTWEESMQITKVYSIAGMLKPEHPLVTSRPFREVHQTATRSSLLGGGAWPRPGEITLASGGVLFLDELAEFPRSVLEVLRQPLEERMVRITRSQGTYEYPADIMLVAATNLCPCGYYPDYNRCTCTPFQINQYQGKISQPFLGRMDICVEVPGVQFEDLKGNSDEETSEDIRRRVERARICQLKRCKGKTNIFNAELSGDELAEYCKLGIEEERMMRQAFETLSLNARTYHKVLKVARTIADLEGKERIGIAHLQEALIYRSIDKKYWGKI